MRTQVILNLVPLGLWRNVADTGVATDFARA